MFYIKKKKIPTKILFKLFVNLYANIHSMIKLFIYLFVLINFNPRQQGSLEKCFML